MVDTNLWKSLGQDVVIGVDEVGRGCLAGDVYAAAVIIDTKNDFDAYTDSKKLTEKKRNILSPHIKENHKWAIGIATVDEIFDINILQASFLAMKRAVLNLKEKINLDTNTGHVLVDGKFPIPDLKGFKQTTVIAGDLSQSPIAAASIIAKVARDKVLSDLSLEYPEYGFERHKGYGTVYHKDAIKTHGPCPVHRRSFAGVKEFL